MQAPELVLVKGARASKASDVFAFGLVMWEVLTWELPWPDEDHNQVGSWQGEHVALLLIQLWELTAADAWRLTLGA